MQLAGAGGQGKSRLALELIEHVHKRKFWRSGFMDADDLEEFTGYWGAWQPDAPHLIVIDYVIGIEDHVGACMKALAKRNVDGPALGQPVRILLVERLRWDKGGFRPAERSEESKDVTPLSLEDGRAAWFDKVNDRAGHDLTHRSLHFGTEAVELSRLDPSTLVDIVLQLAVNQRASVTRDRNAIAAELTRIDPTGRPLFAYLLAHSLIQGDFEPGLSKEALLSQILTRDRNKRWRKALGDQTNLPDSESTAMQLAILATMTRRIECDELAAKCHWPAISNDDRFRALVITDGCYSRDHLSGNIITGIEPDILGEWFVISELERDERLLNLVSVAWRLSPRRMVEFLTRSILDFETHGTIRDICQVVPPNREGMDVYVGQLHNEELDRFLAHVENRTFHSPSLTDLAPRILVGERIRESKKSMSKIAVDYALLCEMGRLSIYDTKQIIVRYVEGASYDIPQALSGLARMYFNGKYDAISEIEAIEYFRRAAEMGDVNAHLSLGIRCLDPSQSMYDLERAKYHLFRAARMKSGNAWYHLSRYYSRIAGSRGASIRSRSAAVVCCLKCGCNLDDPQALAQMGYLLQTSPRSPIELKWAVSFHRAAMLQGNSMGTFNLAFCYSNGIGVRRDERMAFCLFRSASEAGHCLAMLRYGQCYFKGAGVQADACRGLEILDQLSRRDGCKDILFPRLPSKAVRQILSTACIYWWRLMYRLSGCP